MRSSRFSVEKLQRGLVTNPAVDELPANAFTTAQNCLFGDTPGSVVKFPGYGKVNSTVITKYDTGTVSVTNGSDTVEGSGTTWTTNAAAGDKFMVDSDGTWYEVESVTDNDTLVLTENYAGDTASTQDYTITTAIRGVYRYYKKNGDKYLLVACGRDIWKWDTGTSAFVSIGGSLTQNLDTEFATYYDTCIITNGTDEVKKWDGSSFAALGGSPPTGKYVFVNKEKIFIAGNSTNPSMLYWSASGELEDWSTAENAGSANVGKDDGDQIMGISKIHGNTTIFKQNTIWTLYGSTADEFRLEPSNAELGTTNGRTIAETPGGLRYLARDGLRVYDGYNSYNISDDVYDDLHELSANEYITVETSETKNYVGKISGSVVVNPHLAREKVSDTADENYDAGFTEFTQTKYDNVEADDALSAETDGGTTDLQPAAGIDTYCSEDQPTTNYGTITVISCQEGTGTDRIGLIQFDISSVPAGAVSAKLRLYCSAVAAGGNVACHQTTSTWDEGAVTWNTKPTFEAVAEATAEVFSTGWKEWDITTLYNKWKSGDETNYGLYLIAAANTNVNFDSSDNATPANRPILRVDAGNYPHHYFEFDFTGETVGHLDKLTPKFIGYGVGNSVDGLTAKIWNSTDSAWELLGVNTAGSGDSDAAKTITTEITSGISDYISANKLRMMVRPTNSAVDSTATLSVDLAQLDVDTQTTTAYSKLLGLNWKHFYMLNTVANETYEGYVYDNVLKNFSYLYGVSASCACKANASGDADLLYLGDANYGYVYQMDATSGNFDGSGIALDLKTPYHDMRSPNEEKIFAYALVKAKESGLYNLTVDYDIDYGAHTASTDVYLSGTEEISTFKVPIEKPGKRIMLRFRNSGVDQPVEIQGYSIFYRKRKWRG